MKAIKTSCTATTTNGSRCRAAALDGSRYCFFHDPGRAAERRQARVLGGRQGTAKTLASDIPDVDIASSQDVVRLVAGTINDVRKGRMDPRVANAVGYLANVLLKAIDQGDVEARLAMLESVVLTKRPMTTDDILVDLAS